MEPANVTSSGKSWDVLPTVERRVATEVPAKKGYIQKSTLLLAIFFNVCDWRLVGLTKTACKGWFTVLVSKPKLTKTYQNCL